MAEPLSPSLTSPKTPTTTTRTPQTGTPKSAGRAPMSVRQQLALVMQMTADETKPISPQPTTPSATPKRTPLDKVNRKNVRGERPLHVAAIAGDFQLAVDLVRSGAEINARDYAGWTPLHEAAMYGYTDILRHLLRHGAHVNAQGYDDDTALHDACSSGHVEIAELLLRYGADWRMENKKGLTPADVAQSEAVRQLLARAERLTPIADRLSPSAVSRELPRASSPTSSGSEPPVTPEDLLARQARRERSGRLHDGRERLRREAEEASDSSDPGRAPRPSESLQTETVVAAGELEGKEIAAPYPWTNWFPSNDLLFESVRVQVRELGRGRNYFLTISQDASEMPSMDERRSRDITVREVAEGQQQHRPASDEGMGESAGGGDGATAAAADETKPVVTPGRSYSDPTYSRADISEAKANDGKSGGHESIGVSDLASAVVKIEPLSKVMISGTEQAAHRSSNSGETGEPEAKRQRQRKARTKEKEGKPETPKVVPPRKRRVRSAAVVPSTPPAAHAPKPASAVTLPTTTVSNASTPPRVTNVYQQYLDVRKKIRARQRTFHQISFAAPPDFNQFLLKNRRYTLASNAPPEPELAPPDSLKIHEQRQMWAEQESERRKLAQKHLTERERLLLTREQQILRVYGWRDLALNSRSTPLSFTTVLRDQDLLRPPAAEPAEEKSSVRDRFSGRHFCGWLHDVDVKFEKLRDELVLRQHHEADALHACQSLDWRWRFNAACPTDALALVPVEPMDLPVANGST